MCCAVQNSICFICVPFTALFVFWRRFFDNIVLVLDILLSHETLLRVHGESLCLIASLLLNAECSRV
jgi:hypothetical protein